MWHFPKAVVVTLCLSVLPISSSAEIWRDIEYRNIPGVDSNRLSLDIYTPDAPQDAPVLVMIHGGAWTMGDKARAVGGYQPNYFTQQGFVFVSINYRLAPDHPFPAHAEDAAAAVAFIRQSISEYGGDPSAISLMGHSAGAHIAALLSIDPKYLGAEGLDPGILHRTVLLDGAAYDIAKFAYGGKLIPVYRVPFGDDPSTWHAASPAKQTTAETDIPEMLIISVQREYGSEQPEILHRALKSAGHESTWLSISDRTHGTLNRDLGSPKDGYADIITNFILGR